jgi:hypothetical protein
MLGLMERYWIVVFVALVAPWFITGRDLAAAFKNEGVRVGLGQWFGSALFVAFFMAVLFGLIRLLNWIIG